MEVSAEAYNGLGIVGAVKMGLYDNILLLEEFAKCEFVKGNDIVDLFIDRFKLAHDQLRDAEKYICQGLGMNQERPLAGTKYDTPRMLPDDHYYNTKEAVPF